MFEVSGLVESILSVFDSKQYEYTGVKSTTVSESSGDLVKRGGIVGRAKLLSNSTDESRASDSGISTECNDIPACSSTSLPVHNGTNREEAVEPDYSNYIDSLGTQSISADDLVGDNVSLSTDKLHISTPGATSQSPRLGDAMQVPSAYDLDPSLGSADIQIALSSSSVTGSLSGRGSEMSALELSPLSSTCTTNRDVVAHILEHLISQHIQKDRNWQPSGHYNLNPHRSLVEMEEDIGNVLKKRTKAREDARRVLELFLENSLKVDPDFRPSGRYQKSKSRHSPSPYAPKTDTPPASPIAEVYDVSVVLPTNMPSPAAASLRPLSPIIAVESAAERSGEFFVHYPHRDSYYCALYDDFPDDNCLNTVTEALQGHIAIASPETLEEDEDSSPISLIALEPGTTTAIHGGKDYERTEVETTANGVHIHKHIEVEQRYSSGSDSSTVDLDHHDLSHRKKKSFFTRTSERLRHALNRVQRSGSRSENEDERYSVTPRPKKVKKKKKTKLGQKKGSTEVVDEKILQSHQHKFALEGNAQASEKGTGLNADIWRDKRGEADVSTRSVARASTLPTRKSNFDKTDKAKEKQRQKEKEKREKEMKELLKEARNRSNRKPQRSESSKSNESLFKFFSIKKQTRPESPGAKSDKKPFSLVSIMRKSKKKGSNEVIVSNESSQAVSQPVHRTGSLQRPASDKRPAVTQQGNTHHLSVPQSSPQERSKSAEEITSSQTDQHTSTKSGRPSLKLIPHHSRSRSAQDTAEPFDAPTPSSSSTYALTSSKSLSPHKQYVPRSIPKLSEGGNSSRQNRPRRYTPETRQDRPHFSEIDGASSSSGLMAAGAIRTSANKREKLRLPLNVEATVGRTQSLLTRRNGEKVLKTVTSVDEMVSMDKRKTGPKAESEMDSDSEIERIKDIPQAKRNQSERDKMYRHIASKISRLVKAWESDNDNVSSNYNTPLEESFTGMYIGSLPTSGKSSSLERNTSFVSAKSGSSTSSHGQRETIELSSSGAGMAFGSFKMENIPEGEGQNSEDSTSILESSITATDVASLGAMLRARGDHLHSYNPNLSTMFGSAIMREMGNYEVFEKIIANTSTNEQSYLQKITAVFSITSRLWKLAGKTGTLANQIKENALNYIENNVAQYIMSNGGWDSMLEESSSELEVD